MYLAHLQPPPTADPETVARMSAAKFVIKKMFAGGAENIAQLTGEVKLMLRLSHPSIVKVHASESKPSGREGLDIYVVMEFCPGGHLLGRLNKLAEAGKALPTEKILEVFGNIIKPVAYLHAQSPPIAHRDIKFENVLIAADGSLRLCDFGSCSTHQGVCDDRADRAEQEDAITRFTTPHFRAPEMVDLYAGERAPVVVGVGVIAFASSIAPRHCVVIRAAACRRNRC